MILVRKKDGTTEKWSFDKITTAVGKSASRINTKLTDGEVGMIHAEAFKTVENEPIVPVERIHGAVESALWSLRPDVAASYANYRNYRKDIVAMLEEIFQRVRDVLYFGDRENANYNSALISTKGSLARGFLTKELLKKFYLTEDEVSAIEDGWIYIHDLRDLIFNGINCCLFDMGNVLRGGFEMAGIHYQEPKSVLTALQVIGDVTLVATAQQFGGFTIPELDRILVPYALKTIKDEELEARKDAAIFSIADVEGYVKYRTEKRLLNEIKQGLQSLEMKLNTVPSSRGDTAFVTVSFGNCDVPEVASVQRMIAAGLLNTRMAGQGNGSPVVFPKLVYLYSKDQHQDPEQERLFKLAVKCNSVAMYPDYLSLDAGYVGEMYQKHGKVISPMGCRAFLSEYIDDAGQAHFTGRANIGAVSLNLPMIWKKSDGATFFEDLEYYLEMIRKFHQRRYTAVANNVCSTNPLAFTQGGLLGGYKNPTDKVGMDIVKTFTASFGITSLNELNMLMEGKPLHESDGRGVTAVVDFIERKVAQFKEEDGYLYALYGTPAESLAGTQLKQFRKKFGVIAGVSDREYFTNSFHCHVTAEITPYQKQDLEFNLFHRINGGHINYGRMEDMKNEAAIAAFVLRGMELGYYQGVNGPLATCESCGAKPEKLNLDGEITCPECGSHDVTVIDRVCGYLGVSHTNGQTRFNDSKLAETRDRISM